MPIFIHSFVLFFFFFFGYSFMCARLLSELGFTELDKAPALESLTIYET